MRLFTIFVVSLLFLSIVIPFYEGKEGNGAIVSVSDNDGEIKNDQEENVQKILKDSSNYFITNEGQIAEDEILFYSSAGNVFFGRDFIYFRIRELTPVYEENEDDDSFHDPMMEREPDYYKDKGVVLKYTFPGSNDIRPRGI